MAQFNRLGVLRFGKMRHQSVTESVYLKKEPKTFASWADALKPGAHSAMLAAPLGH
jgi:hypothetical protein